jgi:DNA adenine methylase
MLSYIGGKSKIGKWIVPYYLTDMETYVETFGGMFWCFFNMDLNIFPNLRKVVYNDFNSLNYNLFQCAQNPRELQRALDNIPVQQLGNPITDSSYIDRFYEFQTEIFGSGFTMNYPDYVAAAKYVYVVTQVFSGSKPEKSSFIDLKGKYRSKYLAFRDKLTNPKWVTHFLKISNVENMDFQQVIEKYDSPSTYIYLDPPYWKTENYYSNHDFDRNDHERLANVLRSCQSKFSLSYYEFDLLHQWFPQDRYRWERKKFAKAAAAKKGVKQNLSEELLILNY